MNGADFLRGLFGFRSHRFPSDGGTFDKNQDDQPSRDGFHFFWKGNLNPDSHSELFGSDDDANDIGNPQDIFGHFEEVFKQFDQLFSPGFGRNPFEGLLGIPGNDEGDPPNHSPRDYMLKKPFDDPPQRSQQPHTDPVTPPGFFGSIFRPRLDSPKKEDTDLDKEVKNGDLSFLFKDHNPSPRSPSMNSVAPMSEGGIDRVQVHTFSNINGSSEEKMILRDETGAEVTIITRSVGPKKYSKTITRHPDGRQEHSEDFVNMSEGEKEDFKRNWSDNAHGKTSENERNISKYFKDLFRLGFPGFPPK